MQDYPLQVDSRIIVHRRNQKFDPYDRRDSSPPAYRTVLLATTLTAAMPTLAEVVPDSESHGHELHQAPHWSYTGETGPQHWSTLSEDYVACGDGTQQSPIDIDTFSVIDARLTDMQIDWNSQVRLDVMNNGHAIQDGAPDLGTATLDGREYTLKQFHFHAPSEHTVDGRHFPAEAHFVHAAEDGSLAVVGVFLEGGGDNRLLEHTMAAASPVVGTTHIGVEDPRTLLPADRSVFHYQGSLTTPPCSEIVSWNVLQTPIQVSDESLARLTELSNNDNRPVQALQRRFVLE